MLIVVTSKGFAGGVENWQVHMKGATDVVSSLLDTLYSLESLSDTISSPSSSTSSHDSETILLPNEDGVLLKFLFAVFTWIDIAGAVSLGSSPFLAAHHQRLLGGSNPPVRLDKVGGIDNRIMIFIGKIAYLDAWKRTSQLNGTLSIIELAKRATQIETELKQVLDEITKNRNITSSDRPASPYLTQFSVYAGYVTEVYGYSALSYLYVVVSGPYPDLPEIRENVCRTMELLKGLPNPLLPRSLYWAILITGSLALEDEQPLVRSILFGAGVSASSVGMGWNILKTLEECWRRRRLKIPIEPLGDGYWGDVMTSLHMKVMVM